MSKKIKRIKVCFVFASSGIGGAERSMARLMTESHSFSLDCSVVFASSSGNAELVKLLDPVGVKWQRIDPWAFFSLVRAFSDIQPDVVYLFGQIRTLLWERAARLAGVRVVVGAERGSGTRWINRWGRRLDRLLLDAYITNSAKTANVLARQAWVDSDRIHVIYNGVDFPSTPPTPVTVNGAYGAPCIVCVANIRPLKGQLFLLEQVSELRKFYPNAKAVLVGKDLTGGAFFKDVSSKKLDHTFTWTGFLPDVRDVVSSADVFVLPSLSREGMPTSILEAMYLGTPVIGSRVGGVDELILDGKCGIVFEPGDAVGLLTAIRQIVGDQKLRESFIKLAKRRVLTEFTVEKMVESHIQLFEKLVSCPSKSN